MKRQFVVIHIVFGVMALVLVGVIVFEHLSGRGGSQTERSRERLSQRDLQAMSKPGDRARVAREWGTMKRENAAPLLILYAKDPDPEVREACVWALGEVESANGILALKQRTKDDVAAVRVAAVEAIGKLARARKLADAYPILHETLAAGDTPMRLVVVKAFASLGGADAREGLLAAVESDQPGEVRTLALETALGLEVDVALPVVKRAASDPEAGIRKQAVQAIAAQKDAACAPILASAALDPDAEVRAAALAGVKEVAPAFLDALRAQVRRRRRPDRMLAYADLLNGMDAPTLTADLLRMFDEYRGRETALGPVLAHTRELIVARGINAIPELVRVALDEECHPLAEAVAVEAVARCGAPAVPHIVRSITRWKLFPDPDELKQWIRVLGEIGDPAAAPALAFALTQEIEGMEAVVVEAQRAIAAKSGRQLELPRAVKIVSALSNKALLRTPDPDAPQVLQIPRAWQGIPEDGVIRLELEEAVMRRGNRKRAPLAVNIDRREGQWPSEVRAMAESFNKRMHIGALESPGGGSPAELRLRVGVLKDSWVPGGYGSYTVQLPSGQDGKTTYKGEYNGQPVSGSATVTSWNLPAPSRDHVPLAVEEYPRLIFRPHQLDRLRARLATPFGRQIFTELRGRSAQQKILARVPVDHIKNWTPGMEMAIAQGFLALVFEDPLLGRRAADAFMKRIPVPPYAGEHGERMAYPITFQPYGYDLVYAFLTDEERTTARLRMAGFEGIYTFNGGMMGDLSAMFAHVGTVGMVLLNEPGPFVWPEPLARMNNARPEPLTDASLPEGAVVNSLRLATMLEHWLVAGPFPAPDANEPASDFGAELARTSPRSGETLVRGEVKSVWRTAPAEWRNPVVGGGYRTEYLKIDKAVGGSLTYLHAYVRVEETACVRLSDEMPFIRLENRIWINGTPITINTAMVLKPGVYGVLIEVRGPRSSPYWVGLDLGSALGESLCYELEHATWQRAKEDHERTGRWSVMSRPIEMSRARSFERCAGAGEAAGLDPRVPLAYWNAFQVPIYRAEKLELPESLESTGRNFHQMRAVLAVPLLAPEERAPLLRSLRGMVSEGKLSSRELIALLVFWPVDELGRE